MPPLTNRDIARYFEQIGDLLEINGADRFRVNSYRRVARAIKDADREMTDLAASSELATLPGVGKSSAEKIRELLDTGRLQLFDELTADVPPTILELLDIPNLGPKKVALLWHERRIASLAELKEAVESGQLVGLKGFGPKSIDGIRDGLDFLARNAGRVPVGLAFPLAEQLRQFVANLPSVHRVEHAGSLRRGRETVGDLDLLCTADDPAAVIRAFTQHELARKTLVAGDTKASILVTLEAGREIQVDLRVVAVDQFGAAWQYFTGSKEHNVRLRERAVRRGWTLNEYALAEAESGKPIAAGDEAEIYAALDLPWIPPELREDRGEFELTETPRDLLTLDHIRGDLHTHTTASDGKASPEEMIEAALARGYEYLAITDHSQSSVIANGLKPDRLRQHIRAVRAAAEKYPDITVFAGAEVDILHDGRLDYDDKLLAELDWVVASVHFGLGKDLAVNTDRTLRAIDNPCVNLIAHPTGRLIGAREAMPLDLPKICKAAADSGTALEINCAYKRLDLKDLHVRAARDAGVLICIDTDAHTTTGFDQIHFGLWTARRAALTPAHVLNTRPATEINKFVAAKR